MNKVPVTLRQETSIGIYVKYEWIIERLNEHHLKLDQVELQKVIEILRGLDREQREEKKNV